MFLQFMDGLFSKYRSIRALIDRALDFDPDTFFWYLIGRVNSLNYEVCEFVDDVQH